CALPIYGEASVSIRSRRGAGAGKTGSELPGEALEKGLDGGLVAFEEVPLADLVAADQARALQGRQVGRYGGLRGPAALVDHAGAHPALQGVLLVGKVPLGLLEPVEDIAAQRMGQGLEDVVEVGVHGWKYVNGSAVDFISFRDDIRIDCLDNGYRSVRCCLSWRSRDKLRA